MSTDYRILKTVLAADLFDGRLEEYGVREHRNEHTNDRARMLTDGRNFLWLYVGDAGEVEYMVRYMPNGNPGKILGVIADAFDCDIVSEYDCRFYGFESEEEWNTAMQQMEQECADHWHAELMKFLRGEPADICPGTIGMIKANYAKELVAKNPVLLDDREALHAEVEARYDAAGHTVMVELTPQEIAVVKMLQTHEDDLPRA